MWEYFKFPSEAVILGFHEDTHFEPPTLRSQLIPRDTKNIKAAVDTQ